jgi:hypothetical protein
MMMKIIAKLFCWVLTGFTGMAAHAQTFTSSTEKGVDLLTYQTFSVVRGEVVSGGERTVDANALYREIKPLIIRELEARGYTHLDSGAQLEVSYLVETTLRTDVQKLGPLGQAPTTNPAQIDQQQTWSREFSAGTLILTLDDAARNTTVWRSEGTMDISRARGGNVLDYAVKNSFHKFPDRTKKKRSKKKAE